MLKIGYMDGTDARVLTKLAAAGAETQPLGNGWDNAGLYIGHINAGDGFSAVVGYFHKFVPVAESNLTPLDLLKACAVNKIPVFIMAEKADHAQAAKMLGQVAANVKFVDPDDVAAEMMKLMK